MSLEQAIIDLTAEIRVLQTLLRDDTPSTPAAAKREKRAPKPETSPVAEPPVQAPPAATFTPSTPAPDAAGEMPFAEAQSRLAQVAQRLGSPQKVIELMNRYGGPPLTSIPPANFATLVAQAEALQ